MRRAKTGWRLALIHERASFAEISSKPILGVWAPFDFWATWCGGCKVEIPWYEEFQDKYRKDGLAAIGVSMDDDGWKSVKPFLEERKLNYRVVIANQDLTTRYGGVPSVPMTLTLLLDRDGKIAESHAGMVDQDAFENKIKTLLRQSSAK